MTKVIFDVSMSLDGFITGPDEGSRSRWETTLDGFTTGCSTPGPMPTLRFSTSCMPGPERS
jgi:hypothetical protein